MKFEAEDAAHTNYVRLCRSQADGSVRELVLSRAAMHLHTFGVLTGIESGTPGFVSDLYLNSIRTETSVTALELVLAGLWERIACGYRVTDEDTADVARQLHVQLESVSARCDADGGHQFAADNGATCTRCGAHTTVDPALVDERPRYRNGAARRRHAA